MISGISTSVIYITGSATLTVSAKIIAPSITTQPTVQTVQVGKLGLFSITASGTLTYRIIKLGGMNRYYPSHNN
jgi:hypothetical protein